MPKPVIVYVTPKPPYPLTSRMGIRQFHLLPAYGDLGRIHLATFDSDEAQRSAARGLDAHCDHWSRLGDAGFDIAVRHMTGRHSSVTHAPVRRHPERSRIPSS